MTRLMEKAIARARGLPDEEQDALGALILEAIESERRWDKRLARPESAELLSRLADEALGATGRLMASGRDASCP